MSAPIRPTSATDARTEQPAPGPSGAPLPPVSDEVRAIVPATRRVRLREVWQTNDITRALAVRDFKTRYKQSALGPLWLILQPLGILAAFTVVFDGVADIQTGDIPYQLFALVGITVWTFVAAALAFGVRCQIANKRLVTYVACPRITFVNASTLAALPNLLAPLVMTLVSLAIMGYGLTWRILALPAAIAWIVAMLWALSLGLSALNVRFRDVNAFVPFAIQGGLFLTPVAFPLSTVPDTLHSLMVFNPFTGIIEFWRWSILGSELELEPVLIALAMTLAALIGSWRLFTRLEVRFADLI